MTSTNTDASTDLFVELDRRAHRYETACGDGTLVWRQWGKGVPLLLLHGAHGAWSHWIRNIETLSKTRSLWIPDLPGYGESANPPVEEQDAIADALAAGLDHLLQYDVALDVVGFSFGATPAAALASNFPSRVKHLVIVDAGGLGTPLGPFSLQRIRGLSGDERRETHRANLLGFMLHDPKSVDALALHLQESNIAQARLNPAAIMMPDKLLQSLQQLTVPVSAIWGERDKPHPPSAQLEVLRGIFPDIYFRVIQDAGHWVMYEKPEEFNECLLELLANR